MPATIEIEVEDDGSINTNSSFNLSNSIVILEKVKNQLVQRAQIQRRDQQEEGDDEDEE